jgi:hypothetical protein
MTKTWGMTVVWFLIWIPILIFLGYAYSQSGSMFREDDFHLLKTIVWMQDVDDVAQKFKLLIQQHNEHRIILPRLITWLDYTIQGSIHWKVLILIANILWVCVLWFFWKAFRSANAEIWAFIPVPFLLLHPQYFDNINWAISILQQSDIIFWYGLLVLLLTKKKWPWAMLVAVVATFTHGNGIFAFLLGILFCCLERNWSKALQWTLLLITVAIVYFWGFEKGQAADFYASLSDPARLLMSFPAFFGAISMLFSRNLSFSVALGLIYISVLAIYLIPKITQEITKRRKLSFFDKLLLGNVIFLGITAALVAVSRSWGGLDSVVVPRYQHYSSFVTCWVYLTVLVMLKGRVKYAFAVTVLVGAIGFNFLSYFSYHQEVVFRKNWGLAEAENWRNHRVFVSNAKSFNDNIRDTYARSVQLGICTDVPSFLTDVSEVSDTFKPIQLEVTTPRIHDGGATGRLAYEYARISNSDLSGNSFLCLKMEGQKPYWLPTLKSREGLRYLLTKFRLTKPGFSINFSKETLSPGIYTIGVLNDGSLTWTDQTLLVGGG